MFAATRMIRAKVVNAGAFPSFSAAKAWLPAAKPLRRLCRAGNKRRTCAWLTIAPQKRSIWGQMP